MATADPVYGSSLLARWPVVVKTAAYAMNLADCVVLADAAGGAFDVTLPSAVGCAGAFFLVKRTSASNTVTVKSASGTLDGTAAATGVALDAQHKARGYLSDGTNYQLVFSVL